METNKSKEILHKVEIEQGAEQAQQPEINPETDKRYTQNELVVKWLDEFCASKNINQYDVANALVQAVQKRTRINEKMSEDAKAQYDNNLNTVKAMELHANSIRFQEMINREKLINKSLQVEGKELMAREIKAMQTIDNHKSEMDRYNKMFVEAVVHRLVQNAKTPEEKALAEKVSEFAGYKLSDIVNANDAAIEQKAQEIAEKKINAEIIKFHSLNKANKKRHIENLSK